MSLQRLERAVEGEQINDAALGRGDPAGRQPHGGTIGALLRPPRPRVIDQDSSHQVRCGSKKVCAVLPMVLTMGDEPEVGLADEGRGLQDVARLLLAEVVVSQFPQLGVDQLDQA
jgi:hypothetical protein